MSIKPDAFRLLSGADNVTDYQFGTMSVHHRFCRTCGVASYSDGYVEQIGGAFVAISVNCLDDADPTELAEAPVRYSNGRDNAVVGGAGGDAAFVSKGDVADSPPLRHAGPVPTSERPETVAATNSATYLLLSS